MVEPIHNLGPRTTVTSKLEGRQKFDVARDIKKKRKILKKILFKYSKDKY